MASPPVARWFIFARGSSKPARGQPLDGFGTETEAQEYYRAIFKSDPRLELRSVEVS